MESKTENRNVLWGALLVVAGVLLLLQMNFGFFDAVANLFWVAAFGAGGMVFLYLALTGQRDRWWAAIPGMALLGLAGTIFVSEYGPGRLDELGGMVFLGSLGVGFLLVYLLDPENWWALIPGGALLTLGVVAGVDSLNVRGLDSGGILFFGLGLTFLAVAFLPTLSHAPARKWAAIPAAVLLVLGFLIGTPFANVFDYIWPLALVVAGAYLIMRRPAAVTTAPMAAPVTTAAAPAQPEAPAVAGQRPAPSAPAVLVVDGPAAEQPEAQPESAPALEHKP